MLGRLGCAGVGLEKASQPACPNPDKIMPETDKGGETYSGRVQGAWKSSVAARTWAAVTRKPCPDRQGDRCHYGWGRAARAPSSQSSGSPKSLHFQNHDSDLKHNGYICCLGLVSNAAMAAAKNTAKSPFKDTFITTVPCSQKKGSI